MPILMLAHPIFPTLLILLLMLLVPALLPESVRLITPLVLLPAVYFWSLLQPEKLPLWAVFALSLLHDSLMSLPLGASALPLLLLAIGARQHHDPRRGEPFLLQWAHFSLLAAACLSGLYLLMCLYHGVWFPLTPVAVQIMLTLLLYPAIHRLFYPLLPEVKQHGH